MEASKVSPIVSKARKNTRIKKQTKAEKKEI